MIYALPLVQDASALELMDGASVKLAIERSGVLVRHPEIDLGRNRIAIFGHLVALDSALRDQDRVEILRPLTVDPKEARRLRGRRRGR